MTKFKSQDKENQRLFAHFKHFRAQLHGIPVNDYIMFMSRGMCVHGN